MTDLTDDELRARLKYAMGEHGLEPFVEPLRELQNRRVAVAADKERVRGVVREAALRIANPTLVGHETANAIADRVAEQLAGAAVQLSVEELRGLQLMRLHLEDGGHDWREGTAMADVDAATALLDRVLASRRSTP